MWTKQNLVEKLMFYKDFYSLHCILFFCIGEKHADKHRPMGSRQLFHYRAYLFILNPPVPENFV